jgi:hypothetical protein
MDQQMEWGADLTRTRIRDEIKSGKQMPRSETTKAAFAERMGRSKPDTLRDKCSLMQ